MFGGHDRNTPLPPRVPARHAAAQSRARLQRLLRGPCVPPAAVAAAAAVCRRFPGLGSLQRAHVRNRARVLTHAARTHAPGIDTTHALAGCAACGSGRAHVCMMHVYAYKYFCSEREIQTRAAKYHASSMTLAMQLCAWPSLHSVRVHAGKLICVFIMVARALTRRDGGEATPPLPPPLLSAHRNLRVSAGLAPASRSS